jgi:YVTN family beta-propeller protein
VTVYVIADGAVVAIRAAIGTPGRVILAGTDPDAIAVTPDGKTAYVTNYTNGTVIPISTATNTPGTPIPAGSGPRPIAIAP